MTSNTRATRPLLLIGVAMLGFAVAASGCGWIKNKTNYQASKEGNPLEVPPDLDRPDTSAATGVPVVSSAGAPSSTNLGRLPLPAVEAYPRVGAVLATVPGAVINGRAEALNSYDVTYKGESFLLRVLDSAGGSRVVALAADGRLLTSGAAAELVAAIRAGF